MLVWGSFLAAFVLLAGSMTEGRPFGLADDVCVGTVLTLGEPGNAVDGWLRARWGYGGRVSYVISVANSALWGSVLYAVWRRIRGAT